MRAFFFPRLWDDESETRAQTGSFYGSISSGFSNSDIEINPIWATLIGVYFRTVFYDAGYCFTGVGLAHLSYSLVGVGDTTRF